MQELDLPISALLENLASRLGPLFPRSETRDRAIRYIKGLLSQCERKNGWHLAEWVGDTTPDGVQYLLDRARWDEAAARDVLRQWVIETLGASDGDLVLDETGFIKKGRVRLKVMRALAAYRTGVVSRWLNATRYFSVHHISAFLDFYWLLLRDSAQNGYDFPLFSSNGGILDTIRPCVSNSRPGKPRPIHRSRPSARAARTGEIPAPT